MIKKRVGKYVLLNFLDHCKDGSGDLIEIEVVGKIIEEKTLSVRVVCWDLPPSDDSRKENWETYNIIKSTILDAHFLEIGERINAFTKKKKKRKKKDPTTSQNQNDDIEKPS